jgi:hypothetical protein
VPCKFFCGLEASTESTRMNEVFSSAQDEIKYWKAEAMKYKERFARQHWF